MSAFLVGLITVVAFVLREDSKNWVHSFKYKYCYATYKPSRRGKIRPMV